MNFTDIDVEDIEFAWRIDGQCYLRLKSDPGTVLGEIKVNKELYNTKENRHRVTTGLMGMFVYDISVQRLKALEDK